MHTTKPTAIALLLLAASSLGGAATSRWDIAPVFRIEPSSAPLVVQPVISVGLNSPGLFRAPFRCACMLGRGFHRLPKEKDSGRESTLPDPVAAIAAAYLQSRSVRAALLDPDFPVADYREGYFGSWVQDGLLVKERAEFTDEATIRRVFTLLVEAIGEPDDLVDWWVKEPGARFTLNDFRRNLGFVPDLVFEFVGGGPLRVEFNLRQERLLIQAGDRWEVHALDRWSAAALTGLLMAQATAGTSPAR